MPNSEENSDAASGRKLLHGICEDMHPSWLWVVHVRADEPRSESVQLSDRSV